MTNKSNKTQILNCWEIKLMMSEVSKLCWVLLQPNKFARSGGDDDDDGVKRGFRVYGSHLENLLKISVCLSFCGDLC